MDGGDSGKRRDGGSEEEEGGGSRVDGDRMREEREVGCQHTTERTRVSNRTFPPAKAHSVTAL